MAIKLNPQAIEHAEYIIKAGEVERKNRDYQATQDEIAKFLKTHNMDEYAQWFLAIDTAIPEDNKDRYLYAYGDLRQVHREALLQVSKQADKEIAQAAKQLISLIDASDSDVH